MDNLQELKRIKKQYQELAGNGYWKYHTFKNEIAEINRLIKEIENNG